MRSYQHRSTHLQRTRQNEQNNGEISPEEIQRNRERAQRGINKYIAKYKEHMAKQAAISSPEDAPDSYRDEKEADEVARKVSEGDEKEVDVSSAAGKSIQRQVEEGGDDEYEMYTVQKGDTLYSLAKRFNTTVARLKELNPQIPENNTIIAGKQIKIPKQGTTGFQDVVNGRSYEMDIREQLQIDVNDYSANADNVLAKPKFEWSVVDTIAKEVQKHTNALYGKYNPGIGVLAHEGDVKITDLAEREVDSAEFYSFMQVLILKQPSWNPIYPGETVHEVHNAVFMGGDPSTEIIFKIIEEYWNDPAKKAQVIKIRRIWPGLHTPGMIEIDRTKGATEAENRTKRWKLFQTLIHEYMHALAHWNYADRIEARAQDGNRPSHFRSYMIEGATDFFADKVWNSVYPGVISSDKEMRKNIEGRELPYDQAAIPLPFISYTEEVNELKQRVISVHGEANMEGAFFEAKIEKIGL
jgi:LysM repeat protein